MSSGCGAVVDSLAHLGKAALLRRVCGDTLAQFVSALLLALDVSLNFFRMIEEICQAGMNIGQTQHRETQRNFFSSRPLLIVVDDGFEADPRVSNPNRAVFRDCQRDLLS